MYLFANITLYAYIASEFMNKCITTYRFLLMPTKAQQTSIKRSIDCARFIYNQLKATKEVAYNSYGVSFSKFDLSNILPGIKKSHKWLSVHSQVAQDVSSRLDNAYSKFFEGGGYPRWAKKGKYNSITFPQGCSITGDGLLKVPQLKLLRFKDTVGIDQSLKVKQVIIKYDYTENRYFASITCERYFEQMQENDNEVGIDMGIAKLATFSNGKQLENPRHSNVLQKEMRRVSKKLARQEKYGKNWKKTKKILNRLHAKTGNQRKDYLHKLSTDIINENQVIVLEKLKVKNMSASAKGTAEEPGKNVKAKSGLNRSLLDVGIYSFTVMLEYKAKRHGRELIKIDPRYTSQKCSCCGHTAKENRKSQAGFECVECGHKENADINAAKNILEKGILHRRKREASACA